MKARSEKIIPNRKARPMAGNRIINTGEAIREGLSEVGRKDPSVLLFAEGIAAPSSIYGTTRTLAHVYGNERLLEMPITENGLTGIALGAALLGRRTVLHHPRWVFA